MQPITDRAGRLRAITPPGSTESRRSPYQKGMPFCAGSTAAAGFKAAPTAGARPGSACALTVRNTTSASLMAVTSSVHSGCATKTSSALSTRTPRSRLPDRCGHRRVLNEDVVDLARRDLLAAPVDQLLQAPDQRQVAVLAEDALVACPKPALPERGGIRLLVVRVAVDHARPPNHHLAGGPC